MKKVYFEPMESGSILKLSQDDEEKELEFELNYLASLTFEERFKMMKKKSREMLRQMVEHGQRKPFEILKRTSQNPPNSQTEEIDSCEMEG
jgi:hypothetical protein